VTGTPVLRAEDLELGYAARRVLADVSLEIHPGQFWFFLGPNGRGKTTLVRALLGTLKPRSGRLERPAGFADARSIGFVPQRVDLNTSLPASVRDLVLLGLVGLGLRREEERTRLAESLARVGLEGFERREFRSLSGGQRQRVLLARALARRPALLYLDEPTNGLDPASEERFLEELDRLRADGMSLVFVTHVVPLAARHATHVALFHDGRVEAGTRETLFTEERLTATYGLAASRWGTA
jgi:ABC-type Mn2+/Zn2+ transport system ATPase subunit